MSHKSEYSVGDDFSDASNQNRIKVEKSITPVELVSTYEDKLSSIN